MDHNDVEYTETSTYTPGVVFYNPQGQIIGHSPGYTTVVVEDNSLNQSFTKVFQDGQAIVLQTKAQAWIDAIYLSQTSTVGPNDQPIAFQDDYSDPLQNPTLNLSDTYSTSQTIQLPAHMAGTWYVVVIPNVLETASASAPESSDEGSVAIPITATPGTPAPGQFGDRTNQRRRGPVGPRHLDHIQPGVRVDKCRRCPNNPEMVQGRPR